MGVVSNRDIKAGEEVCISYIEHDVLCESAYRRNQMLTMDFLDCRADETSVAVGEEENGPDLPVVDTQVQNELMGMGPFERLTAIEELMQQATGAKLPQEEAPNEGEGAEAMEETGSSWFQCDVQNLRILKAITLDGMGQCKDALPLWEDAIVFAESSLPPLDESSVVVRVQAALCAHHTGDVARGKQHAEVALNTHNLLFGGGVERFKRRFRNDFLLPIRPAGPAEQNEESSPVDVLLPAQQHN